MFSCLFLTTYYQTFINGLYQKNTNLATMSYNQQLSSLLGEFFGDSDFYSEGLKKAGWESRDIIMNCSQLQRTWSLENNYSGNNIEIISEQIRREKPNVVYLHDLTYITTDFLRTIRPYTELIVGQAGSPLPPTVDLSLIDIIFSCVPSFVEHFRRIGNTSYYQPLAFDPRVIKTIISDSQARNFPLTFIGGFNGGFHKTRQQILENIASQIDIDFWGYGVKQLSVNSPLLKKYHGEVWGKEMFAILSKSRMTINCHIEAALNYAANMRLYEATGCGALLLTDYKDNLNELFEVGKEVVAYRSPEECVALIKYYLTNPKETDKIARAGQKRTNKDHTYAKRMEKTAKILERHLDNRRKKKRCSVLNMTKENYEYHLPNNKSQLVYKKSNLTKNNVNQKNHILNQLLSNPITASKDLVGILEKNMLDINNKDIQHILANPQEVGLSRDDLSNKSKEQQIQMILGEYYFKISQNAGQLASELLFKAQWGYKEPDWFDHRHNFIFPEKWCGDGYWTACADNVLRVLPLHGTLLDLCSGDGFYDYHFFRKRAQQIDCVEIQAEVFRHALRHHQAKNIHYQMDDVLSFIPKESYYDVVFIRSAIEHFSQENQELIFQKAKYALKPGGWFCGDTPANPNKGPSKQLSAHENEWRDENEMRESLGKVFNIIKTYTMQSHDRTTLFWRCQNT